MKSRAPKTRSGRKTGVIPQAAPPTRAPDKTDVLAGIRVRLRRKELGLSQTVLANRLGITFQQVQKYEKGTNRISASRLEAMSSILGVPISYFFPEPEDGEAPEAQVGAALDNLRARDLLRHFASVSNPALRIAVRGLIEAIEEANRAEPAALSSSTATRPA